MLCLVIKIDRTRVLPCQVFEYIHLFSQFIAVIMPVAVVAPANPGGIKSYYQAKIEAAELTINRKTQNLRRLEAQRNALNARGMHNYEDQFRSYLIYCGLE